MEDGLVYTDIYVILPEIKLRQEEAFLKRGGYVIGFACL